jgi:hypothetical protein
MQKVLLGLALIVTGAAVLSKKDKNPQTVEESGAQSESESENEKDIEKTLDD